MSPNSANYPVAAIKATTKAGTGNARAWSGAKLLYDGECQLCNGLACSLKQSNPDLEIIDARQASAERASAEKQGIDLNEGMVMIVDGRQYYADEALTYSAGNLRAEGLTGGFMRLLFRHKRATQTLYPVLVLLRKLLLRLAGKSLIDDQADLAPLQDSR
jgi:predicted DCC family thiol-disulfide oxidoreductase YuxK